MRKSTFALGCIAILIAICLSSCKTRQVNKSESTHQVVQDSTQVKKQLASTIDTSKKTVKQTTKTADTTTTEITIITDSGEVQHLVADNSGKFRFTGKTRSVNFKSTAKHTMLANNSQFDVAGKSTSLALADSVATHKKAADTLKNKTIESKSDIGKNLEWIGIILVISAAAFLYIKHRRSA